MQAFSGGCKLPRGFCLLLQHVLLQPPPLDPLQGKHACTQLFTPLPSPQPGPSLCVGDLRRSLAAAERLVMLVGDEDPQERRDLAILLLHANRLEEAQVGCWLLSCMLLGLVEVTPASMHS